MNRLTRAFCRTVLLLDRLPRYGRVYTLPPGFNSLKEATRAWRWSRHGSWGVSILSKMNLFWKYVDYYSPYDWDMGCDCWHDVPGECVECDSYWCE